MRNPWVIRGINLKWIILMALIIAAYLLWPSGKRYPPGVLIKSTPRMEMLEGAKSWSYRAGTREFTLTPRAQFAMEARVLSVNKEYDDVRIGPLDIVVGWGAMSDQKVLDGIRIWQDNTRHWFCMPRGREWPIPMDEVGGSAVNTHIIPADREIEKKLMALRKGDLISLKGLLVDVSGEQGFSWRTSVTPGGFGDHSCKIIWVQKLDRR
ncbi:MAG: hypothetical protein RDV48_25290 [Candidatus Eremiobacteraeota bacterium]|nr:hypothetical protein [Candidatus Eremiobacteraeota bacterium]